MNKKSGFTLAEIIITLTIIGVVAAMTIPAMIQEVQDKQLRIAWKKAYSDISQASSRVAISYNNNLTGIFTNSEKMRDLYLQYLNYNKSCNYGVEGCWHPIVNGFPAFKYLNGDNQDYYTSSGTAILNNGNLVQFVDHTSGIEVGRVLIDINGYKLPNTLGKDIFQIIITKFGYTKPDGFQGSSSEGDCNPNSPSSHGWGCAAKYLYE